MTNNNFTCGNSGVQIIQGQIQDLATGGPKNFLSVFANCCVNKVNPNWPWSRAHLRALEALGFLVHLVFYQMSLCNHDLSVVHSCHLASASVHRPPSHRIQDRNFIFSMNMHMCPQYMHIKYLVILTCSF